MFHLDGSETSWLVYADWLEDQDINATHIRESVVNPTTNQWIYETWYTHVGAGGFANKHFSNPVYGFNIIGSDYGNIGGCGYDQEVGSGERHSYVGGFNGY